MQNKVTYWIKEIKCTKEPDLKNYKLIEEFTKYDEFYPGMYNEEIYEKNELYGFKKRITKITKEWDDPKPWKET